MSVIDSRVKKRKFWKSFKNIIFGKNIFQVFFRIYLLTILVGAIFLYTPLTHSDWNIKIMGYEREYTFWDALFLSCSSFSNTGLSMLTISSFFNIFGQIVLLFLIQVGGIGLVSLAFVLWNLFKKEDEVKMNQIIMLQNERGTTKLNSSFKSIRFSVYLIITVEIIFGFLMSFWLCWFPVHAQSELSIIGKNVTITYDQDALIEANGNYGLALWQGMFCSISAINNAGFDIFESDCSLAAFRNDWNIIFQLFTMIEIIIGGIGYPLIFDYYEKIRHKRKGLKYNTSLFTKVALCSYLGVLLIGLAISYTYEFCVPGNETLVSLPNEFVLENGQTIKVFGEHPTFNKCWIIFYNTVSTRSAGFSTIDQHVFTKGTMLNYIVMMFVGGSPSSTAGGIRTTTLMVIIAAFISTFKGRSHTTLFKKTIPNETVKNSFLAFILGVFIVILVSIIIYYLPTSNPVEQPIYKQDWDLVSVLYEVSSAFGTVGLSYGVTSLTSSYGLVAIIVCMFIGQLGVSTSLLAWFKKIPTTQEIKYSTEDIKIG